MLNDFHEPSGNFLKKKSMSKVDSHKLLTSPKTELLSMKLTLSKTKLMRNLCSLIEKFNLSWKFHNFWDNYTKVYVQSCPIIEISIKNAYNKIWMEYEIHQKFTTPKFKGQSRVAFSSLSHEQSIFPHHSTLIRLFLFLSSRSISQKWWQPF